MPGKYPPEIPGSRPLTYFGLRALDSTCNDLLHPPLCRRIGDALRRLRCAVLGHIMVTQRWVSLDDTGRGEMHIGCVRCPEFKTEKNTNMEAS